MTDIGVSSGNNVLAWRHVRDDEWLRGDETLVRVGATMDFIAAHYIPKLWAADTRLPEPATQLWLVSICLEDSLENQCQSLHNSP